MVKLLLVQDGAEDEIAKCMFTDDGEMLFESYKKRARHHVKLVYCGIFSEPQIAKEFIPGEGWG